MEPREPINKQAACALSRGTDRLKTIEEAVAVITDIINRPAWIKNFREAVESGHDYEVKIVAGAAHGGSGFHVSMRTRVFMDKPNCVHFKELA